MDDSDASESGPDPGSFILTRSNDGIISQPLEVRVDVSGTAGFGKDYTNPGLYGRIGTVHRVQIPRDTLSKTLTILPIIDAIVEGDETVIFSLAASSSNTYIVGEPANADIIIKDFVESIFKDSFENF